MGAHYGRADSIERPLCPARYAGIVSTKPTLEVVGQKTRCCELLGIRIRYCNAECVLYCHKKFNRIQAQNNPQEEVMMNGGSRVPHNAWR